MMVQVLNKSSPDQVSIHVSTEATDGWWGGWHLKLPSLSNLLGLSLVKVLTANISVNRMLDGWREILGSMLERGSIRA
jgi:hypothetical protein